MTHLNESWTREANRLGPTSLTENDMNWARGPDAGLPWVPESLLPLCGCAGYGALTPAQRLAYNQAYGRQLLEEFIWIESRLIVAPLRRLLKSPALHRDAATVLASFLADELSHIACFARLRDAAQAAAGGAGREKLFRPPGIVEILASLAGRAPAAATFWTGAVAAFEDYAIGIGKHYKEDETLDGVFRDVFLAHARDEARHCRFDALLHLWLAPSERRIANALNVRLGALFQRRYYHTGWGLDGAVDAMVDRFADLAGDRHALYAEARNAREARAKK